jgi:long-subunit fatty acid transport protein
MMFKRLLFIFSLFCFLFFVHTSAWALVASNDFFGFEFRFNNPGARSTAMGGAFVGLADDATAAYANPAGLTILTEPEISAEIKYGEYTNQVPQENDTDDFTDSNNSVSFLSLAHPTKKANITVYRHHLLNIKSEYDSYENVENRDTIEFDLNVVTLGLGVGFKVTETFSLGFSVGFAQLEYYSQIDKYDLSPTTDPQPSEFEYVNDEDSSEQYTLALLWNPTGKLSVGAVYRYGPEFDTDKERWEQIDLDPDPVGTDYYWVLDWKLRSKLKIPDVYGLGISYRFLSNLTAALDVNYVEYSDLLEDFTMEPNAQNDPDDIEIDDTFEIHAGVEYVMGFGDIPVALRCGYFYRPDHSARYVGPITSPDDQALKDRLANKDYDEHIFSAGFGTVLFDILQVDVAASYSELITEGTISVVYRF